MAGLAHWTEWKLKCALGLCEPATRCELKEFARARFLHYAGIYYNSIGAEDAKPLIPDADEAWHLFETHLCLTDSRAGKSYKEWLFSSARMVRETELDSVQGGATLIMRDVVRERLRREYAPRWIASLDAPVGVALEGHPLTLGDLLPARRDSANDPESDELLNLAAADADGALATLGRRERIALLANALGLSLAHPSVVSAGACSKSSINAAFHAALVGLASHVRLMHPRESREVQATLACLVFEEAQRRIICWGKLENGCAQLFLSAGQGPSDEQGPQTE